MTAVLTVLCIVLALFAGCAKKDPGIEEDGADTLPPFSEGGGSENGGETLQTNDPGDDSVVLGNETTDLTGNTTADTRDTTTVKTTTAGKTTTKATSGTTTVSSPVSNTPLSQLVSQTTASQPEAQVKDKNAVVRVGTLENLMKILNGMGAFNALERNDTKTAPETAAATTAAAAARTDSQQAENFAGEPAATSAQSDAAAGDHSTTNTKVEGVDESDIVKTDGKYI